MKKGKAAKIILPAIIAVICGGVAIFFDRRLSGYGIMALLFFAVAIIICVFVGLSILGQKHEKAARVIRRTIIGLLCIGTLYFCIVEAVIVKNSRSDQEGAEYLIVLGAGVDGRQPSLILWNRLEAALSYLNEHPEAKAVVSGAQGRYEEITEAECMYVWLTERGISPNRVIMEDKARSTAQNIEYSMPLIRADAGKENPSIAVLSSEFHLFRAKLIASKHGISKPIGVSAHTTLPVIKINYYIREAFAVTAFWVFGQ